MRCLTIDFEGSLKKGIREIGFVVENNTEKIRYGEIIIENEEHSVQVLNEVLSPKPELFISHNVHVEKNLIKKYLPYSVKNLVMARFNGDLGLIQEFCIKAYIPSLINLI